MTNETEAAVTRASPRGGLFQLGLGLALTPVAVAIAASVLPGVPLGELAANATAFAGATLFPIAGLSLAARVELRLPFMLGAALMAAALLITLAIVQPASIATVLLADTALVCLAWALGCPLGRRAQHPAHLLPACVVAASADLVSLLSPEGPSHAVAESERALSVLATWFPVPGGLALTPALGIGDLLFMALVLGAARAHRLPYARCVAACAVGTALSGLAAAWCNRAVPALVPIAAALIVLLPAIRRVRPSDRAVTRWSILLAGSVALAAVLRALLSRP